MAEGLVARCSQCDVELGDDGKTRKRNRTRKCGECVKQAAIKRRRDDPVRLLSHRWNNSCRRLYADPPSSMWATATVKAVLERCEYKSVISGETNTELLCVFTFFMARDFLPTIEQLVIVTSREAQSISKEQTQEKRSSRFPAHVRAQMEK